jgi:alkylhydroperoxidase/carboxymuconolactone decarboxylase family protein YurZ
MLKMAERSKEIIEKIKKDRPTYTSQVLRSREILAKEDPEYLELFHRMHMHVVHEKSALPTKIKEIIISAVDAATHYERGLRVHIRGALEAGASREEIFEGLQAASLPAGIHVLSISLPILEDVLKEFNEAKAKK